MTIRGITIEKIPASRHKKLPMSRLLNSTNAPTIAKIPEGINVIPIKIRKRDVPQANSPVPIKVRSPIIIFKNPQKPIIPMSTFLSRILSVILISLESFFLLMDTRNRIRSAK